MAEIPESLLRRSAEAKAKALGLPVEQVLAEMKGEVPPAPIPTPVVEEPVASPEETPDGERQTSDEAETPNSETPAADRPVAETPKEETPEPAKQEGKEAPEETPEPAVSPPEPESAPEPEKELVSVAAAVADSPPAAQTPPPSSDAPPTTQDAPPAPEAPTGNGSGNGKRAALVQPRPVAPAAGVPEGVRTQRLLTVVKARAIQQVKTEPTDKVNTWPHLMIGEFAALMVVTGVLIILSVILQAPLLDPANFNATPNPSKAPWYFLGLQELLSYFDPQIAGVTVPTIVGLIGFMAVPYVDRNPSTKPSDRKFAIMLYTIFMAGAATLTIFGVLFRGRGFNFSYPWKDGVFFDDLKDWVFFE
jgi:menaquinol-cytochrome c reductase cytochrome b/c subunit